MKLNVLADTISTYLTLASALVLPVLMCAWARSYLVTDRIYHADDGTALVTGVSNGVLSFWTAPTRPDLEVFHHRSRQGTWGWSTRRTFQRFAGPEHVWFAGFGYAEGTQIPWRGLPLTGKAKGVSVPMWFLALVVGALPMRLLARNMQSSQDFLAQRARETGTV